MIADESADIDVLRARTVRELDMLNGERFPELDHLIALAADICGAEASFLSVFDETHEIQISVSSGERTRKPREVTFCTHTLRGRSNLLIEDARLDARLSRNPYVLGEPFVCSYAGVCVGASRETPLGVICVIDSRAARFGAAEMRQLERVAKLVNIFLTSRLETKRAERAAEKTEAERRRQKLSEEILDSIWEGVVVYDSTGRLVDSNAAARAILQVPEDRDDFGGHKPLRDYYHLDGRQVVADEYPINRVIHHGERVDNFVMGFDQAAGGRRWLSISAQSLIVDRGRDEPLVVVTLRDITNSVWAEQKLKEALQSAERASQAKTDFLSVMSHELRTPMNAVLGCATLLNSSRLEPTQARTLGVLEDAGRQMLALLNDLFDLSSLETGKVRLFPEPTNLVRLIEDAAVIWASEVRSKGLTLSVMINPELRAPREVDPARVLQIIGNLMANAIKFTAEGSVTIQAWLTRSRSGADMAAIEVSDTGPGVPPEAAERIFSPFEQVDVSTKRRHGGLGIGLYVARRLAQAMGGDIELESRPGEGSTFTVRLEAPFAEPAPEGPSEPDEQAPLVSRSVLCVDDNPRNLFVIGAVLRAAEHEVIECASGAEALTVLAARKVDIVLLDMVMPEMDGLDVMAQVRADPGPNADTPIIACTANVSPDQVKAYLDGGAAGVIAKPIDVAQVLKVVATLAA